MAASKKKVDTWGAAELGLSKEEVGLSGSAVQVMKAEAPVMGRKNVIFKEGELPQLVEELVKALVKEGVLKV
jgi:electron transfer flavoprotein alpha/beta subunit